MDDLRVWVDGVERVVRGANEETTCENILLALASATGKLGRFALLEKWRDLERILPREAKPIKCLKMWGSQASEVKFVLKLMKDKSLHIVGKVGAEEHGVDEEESLFKTTDDPFHRSFERKSLESIVANQSNKVKRVERDLEIVQLRLDCCIEDEENYLYFTEEEIAEDRVTKLGHVLKLQAKELATEETCLKELAKERTRQEKLQLELHDQKSKLHHLDVHISDLENVGSKIYSMRVPQDTKSDKDHSSTSVDSNDLEELAQEITVTREELFKQRDLAERQIEEVALMKRSFAELENLSRQKSFQLLALKGEQPSPELNLAYYDLDENLDLDGEHETSINCVDDNINLRRDKIKLNSTVVRRSSSRDGTKADLSSPGTMSTRESPAARQRFLANGIDDLDDPGVYV